MRKILLLYLYNKRQNNEIRSFETLSHKYETVAAPSQQSLDKIMNFARSYKH